MCKRKNPSSRATSDIKDSMKWGQEAIQIRILRYESTQCPRESLLLLDETSKFCSTIFYKIPTFAFLRLQWFWGNCHDSAPFYMLSNEVPPCPSSEESGSCERSSSSCCQTTCSACGMGRGCFECTEYCITLTMRCLKSTKYCCCMAKGGIICNWMSSGG